MLERPQTGILQKKEIPAILNAMGQGRDSLALDGITPSFALNFAEGGSIRNQAATATFTRATTATVVDQDSIVRSVLSGEARMQGLRRIYNRVANSNNASGYAGINKAGTATIPTVTGAFGTAPDGTTTASRIQYTCAGATNSDISYVQTYGLSGSAGIRTSCWLKTNDGSTATLSYYCGVGGSDSATTITVTSSWQRFTPATPSITTEGFYLALRGDTKTSNTADILIWGVQLENVSGASVQTPGELVSVGVLSTPYHGANVDGVKYFPTLNGNTVSNNIVTEAAGAYIPASTRLGYLSEGARTNLGLQSQDFSNATWTKTRCSVVGGSAVTPDGLTTTNAGLVEDATAASTHLASQAFTWTAVVHTVSVYAKASGRNAVALFATDGVSGREAFFDLATGAVGTVTNCTATITALANGWYRCTMTSTAAFTAAAGTAEIRISSPLNTDSYNGNGASGILCWGFQIEAAAFASSYIPTTTVAVTRNADVLTYPLTGWFNTTFGTMFWQGQRYQSVALNQELWSINDGTTNNRFSFFANGTISVNQTIDVATVNQVNSTTGNSTTANTTFKAAAAYATNDFAVTLNSGTIVGDASGSLPTVTIAQIGAVAAANQLFGTTASIQYYPRRLTNTQLQNMTR